jgi:hypothetical protein
MSIFHPYYLLIPFGLCPLTPTPYSASLIRSRPRFRSPTCNSRQPLLHRPRAVSPNPFPPPPTTAAAHEPLLLCNERITVTTTVTQQSQRRKPGAPVTAVVEQ